MRIGGRVASVLLASSSLMAADDGPEPRKGPEEEMGGRARLRTLAVSEALEPLM